VIPMSDTETFETVSDVPDSDEWVLVTGSHERDIILDHIREDPSDWSHGSLFVRSYEGAYTDVLFFGGTVPYLNKDVTRVL